MNFCKKFVNPHSRSSFCHLFKNCLVLDVDTCPDCKSGQEICAERQCNIEGQCSSGFTIEHEEWINSGQGCLKLCQSTSGCNWYTYYGGECTLYKVCFGISTNCGPYCISGERGCVLNTTTTTTTISSFKSSTKSTDPLKGNSIFLLI